MSSRSSNGEIAVALGTIAQARAVATVAWSHRWADRWLDRCGICFGDPLLRHLYCLAAPIRPDTLASVARTVCDFRRAQCQTKQSRAWLQPTRLDRIKAAEEAECASEGDVCFGFWCHFKFDPLWRAIWSIGMQPWISQVYIGLTESSLRRWRTCGGYNEMQPYRYRFR